jgi:hypothetical protein
LPVMPKFSSPITNQTRLLRYLAGCWLLSVSCLAFCFPLTAWGMGLDTEGKAPLKCIPKFKLETLQVTKVRPTVVSYEFVGHIEDQPSSSAAACPPPGPSGSTVVRADWNYSSKVAAEVGGRYDGSTFVSVTSYLSKCEDDPWLNPNIKCEQIGNHSPKGGWPEPRPFSPPVLSQTQRDQLVKEVEALAVPEIAIPSKDQVIKGTSSLFRAKVYLPTPSLAATQPVVTFEIKEKLWPGVQYLKKTVTAPVTNHYAMVNVPLKHGNFQVRARISTPASQKWSKTVFFKLAP